MKLKWLLWLGGGGAVLYFLTRTVMDLTDRAQWAKFLFDEITSAVPNLSVRTRLMMVAHAAYESGWGQKSSAMKAGTNNLWNITAGPAWKGPTSAGGDTDGAGKPIVQQWRVYPSYRAAIQDYWSFLGPDQNGGRYVKARAALEDGDLQGFARELYSAGYFTLSPGAYASALAGVYGSVSDLLDVIA